jgi:hypothetical protein
MQQSLIIRLCTKNMEILTFVFRVLSSETGHSPHCAPVVRFSMINKVAITHCSFLRLQIKREDISTNAVSVTKTEVYTILRDVCIVSNRLTCIDSKLSEMEILAQPLSLPFIIENLMEWRKVPRYI